MIEDLEMKRKIPVYAKNFVIKNSFMPSALTQLNHFKINDSTGIYKIQEPSLFKAKERQAAKKNSNVFKNRTFVKSRNDDIGSEKSVEFIEEDLVS